MFIPTTLEEARKLGWNALDVILVTGDSYIDSPYIGVAVIGKVLMSAGYRVGVIAQPDTSSENDMGRLGMPRLFWGVSAGCVDSMVANYNPLKQKRNSDDCTPGGQNTRRPDRASIVYTGLIRKVSKKLTAEKAKSAETLKNSAFSARSAVKFAPQPPIVLGGIEASLRRVPHYDYWSDQIRPSLLFEANADYILYGMAEKSVVELANALQNGLDPRLIRGLSYASNQKHPACLELPPYEVVANDRDAFIEMFHTFYKNNDPLTARGLTQAHDDRWLVQNPPALPLTQPELDAVYAIRYERAQHPHYEKIGPVSAVEKLRFSIPTHRGCYGECNFCAVSLHEGRTVQWRSPASILAEAQELSARPDFQGNIQHLGGPTVNMYGFECRKKLEKGVCAAKRCMYPKICNQLRIDHRPQIELLRRARSLPGVKKIFVTSDLRYDIIGGDRMHGMNYLRELAQHHTAGQLEIAPEHSENHILAKMGKPGKEALQRFQKKCQTLNQENGQQTTLSYAIIAAYPGCTEKDMQKLKQTIEQGPNNAPLQAQIFTPIPSTYASLMYYTELDPITPLQGASRQPLFVEKDHARKERQKQIVAE